MIRQCPTRITVMVMAEPTVLVAPGLALMRFQWVDIVALSGCLTKQIAMEWRVGGRWVVGMGDLKMRVRDILKMGGGV